MVRNYERNQKRITANAARKHASDITSFLGIESNQVNHADEDEVASNTQAAAATGQNNSTNTTATRRQDEQNTANTPGSEGNNGIVSEIFY